MLDTGDVVKTRTTTPTVMFATTTPVAHAITTIAGCWHFYTRFEDLRDGMKGEAYDLQAHKQADAVAYMNTSIENEKLKEQLSTLKTQNEAKETEIKDLHVEVNKVRDGKRQTC